MNNVEYLIISSTIDYSSDLICAELEKRGYQYLRINRDKFAEYKIIYSLATDSINLKMGDEWFLLSNNIIKAIYFRAPVFLRASGKAYSLEDQLKRSQWSSFIRNLIIFDKAVWVNNPVDVYKSENKAYQLKVAQACGMNIPLTYIGNSFPSEIVPDEWYIVKSLDTALFHDMGKEMFTYSTLISGRELLEAEISQAPIILQEYLKGKIDLRVTVVGNEIFPVEITKAGLPLEGDWRQSNKDNLEYTITELPDDVICKIRIIMKHLNIHFGGVDLARVNNEYYFIEVNPTGEWGWLRTSVGIPVDRAIVDFMEK